VPIPVATTEERVAGPARDLIADRLREWIVAGVLAPGEILRDVDVAQRFAVSRTPVREALLQLRSEGLVEMKPQGWTQVKPIEPRKITDLLRVVVDLEALAARLAAERPAQERDVAPLVTANEALRELIAATSETRSVDRAWSVVEANDEFHNTIVTLAGNEYLTSALLPLKTLMRRYERIAFSQATPINGDSLDQHDLIIAAIRDGDGSTAAELVAANFSNAPVLGSGLSSE
jgi:DNA-binding GntR family transcriptional regulator